MRHDLIQRVHTAEHLAVVRVRVVEGLMNKDET